MVMDVKDRVGQHVLRRLARAAAGGVALVAATFGLLAARGDLEHGAIVFYLAMIAVCAGAWLAVLGVDR